MAMAVAFSLFGLTNGLRAASPFAFGSPGGYGIGMSPSAVVAGDFSGDSKADLIGFWTDGQGALLCLAGNGDGTFATPGALYQNFTMRHGAAGDFNGDGKLDLLAVNASFPFARVLLNVGSGSFSNPTTVFLTGNPFSAAVADFNRHLRRQRDGRAGDVHEHDHRLRCGFLPDLRRDRRPE
jgi:hypothetical protein